MKHCPQLSAGMDKLLTMPACDGAAQASSFSPAQQDTTWLVSPWAACSACEGVTTRAATCLNLSTGQPNDPRNCSADTRPAVVKPCTSMTLQVGVSVSQCVWVINIGCVPLGARCVTATSQPQVTNSNIVNEVLVACPGAEGRDGSLKAGPRPCDHGVLDAKGHCCAAGRLDACGVCNGTAIAVDIAGVLLSATTLKLYTASSNFWHPPVMHVDALCSPIRRVLRGHAGRSRPLLPERRRRCLWRVWGQWLVLPHGCSLGCRPWFDQ